MNSYVKKLILALMCNFTIVSFSMLMADPTPPKGNGLEKENPATCPDDPLSLEKFDTNKNGKLDEDERKAWEKAVLDKYDVDKNGILVPAELKKFHGDQHHIEVLAKEKAEHPDGLKGTGLEKEMPSTMAGVEFCLDDFDKNKNGKLDPDERSAWEKAVLKKYDSNKDGYLDSVELEKWKSRKVYGENIAKMRVEENSKPPPPGTGLENEQPSTVSSDPLGLAKYDTNHNGKLDPEERPAWEKDMLARYDENHNGHIDPSELHVWKHGVGHMEGIESGNNPAHTAGKKKTNEKADSDKTSASAQNSENKTTASTSGE